MYTTEQYLLAARNGNSPVIRAALASGIDVNATLATVSNTPGLEDVVPGTTALMLAAAGGHTNSVKLFLNEKNANVKARNAHGQTVFTAVLTSKLPKDIGQLGEIFDLAVRKLLYKNPNICTAAEKQQYLTDMCIDPASPHLVYAAERGMFKAVTTLIALGVRYNLAYPGSIPTLDGRMHVYNPLHAAIAHDHTFISNMLLSGYYEHNKEKVNFKAPTVNKGSFHFAVNYGGIETIDAVRSRLPVTDQEDINWFDVIVNTVLARRFMPAPFGKNTYRMPRVADHLVARDLTVRYIDADEKVIAEEILLAAASAGAGEFFIKLMLQTYKCDINCTDIFSNTLLVRALGSDGFAAVPGLVKHGADLRGIDRHYLAANEHIFVASSEDKFLKGSILAYAAFNSNYLLQALLSLEEEIYPRAMKQKQLDYVCDETGATVTQTLLASPVEYAQAIALLRECGFTLEHTPSRTLEEPAQASTSGSPRRWLPSLSSSCIKLQESASTTFATADKPTSQYTESSSPTRTGFGQRLSFPSLDLFKKKSAAESTPVIEQFETITISESPKKKSAPPQQQLTLG